MAMGGGIGAEPTIAGGGEKRRDDPDADEDGGRGGGEGVHVDCFISSVFSCS